MRNKSLVKYNVGIEKNNKVFFVSRFAIDFSKNEFFYHFIYGKNLVNSRTFFEFISKKNPADSHILDKESYVDHLSFHNSGIVHAKFKKEKKNKYLVVHDSKIGVFDIADKMAVTSPLLHQIHYDQTALLSSRKSEIWEKNHQILFKTADYASFSLLFFIGSNNINIPQIVSNEGIVKRMKIMSSPVVLDAPNNKILIVCLCLEGLPTISNNKENIQIDLHRFEVYPDLKAYK